MEWSTPMRISAVGKPIPPIPNELYLEIFKYVAHAANIKSKRRMKSLKNLSLVCRLFHTLAFPRIFRRLHIRGDDDFEQVITASTAVFCISVLKKRQSTLTIARQVEECVLEDWDKDIESDQVPYISYVHMYKRALGQFSNLQSLTIRRALFDFEFLQVVSKLKALTHLSLDNVTIDFGLIVVDEDWLQFPSLTLKEFSFLDYEDGEYDDEESLSSIPYFIDLAQLKNLTIRDFEAAETILPNIHTNDLLSLVLHSMEPEILPSLWNALEKLRALETFEFDMLPGDVKDISPTPPAQLTSALPNLRRLACPPSMLSLAVGRPISSISILVNDFISDETAHKLALDSLSSLNQSSTVLADLWIPWRLYSCAPFLETLPGIKRLHISTESQLSMRDVVSELITTKPEAPTLLNALRFTGPFDVPQDWPTSLLPQLALAFPSLLEAQLEDGSYMCRDNNKDSWRRCDIYMG